MSNIRIRPLRLIYTWSILAILASQFGSLAFILGLLLTLDAEMK